MYLGKADASDLLVVDVSNVDGRDRVDRRARDERVHIEHKHDLIDSVNVHGAELVRADPTRRAASQLTECHHTPLPARCALYCVYSPQR